MAYHYEAVELRYTGKNYTEITTALTAKYNKEFKLDTVRHWFSRGGYLEKEYLDYAKKENLARQAVTVEELRKLAPKIPIIFSELLERVARKPFTGEVMNDDKGKPLRKLDMVTVVALKNLMAAMGFKMPDGDATDPLDEYFDKLEDEAAKGK